MRGKPSGEFPQAGLPPQGQRVHGQASGAGMGDSLLCLLGKGVSHVAVWYWNRKVRRLGQFEKLAPFLTHSSITSSWTTGLLCV